MTSLDPHARRAFLRQAFWSAGMAGSAVVCGLAPSGASAQAVADAPLRQRLRDIGPLGEPDANGIRLPAGMHSRVVAVSGKRPAPGSSYAWHGFPDGGATFAMPDGGWCYVSNSELPVLGGVGMLRFDAGGGIVDARRLLGGTTLNCAGGKTPWGTWLSGEEFDLGRVWEVDPSGATPSRSRPALGIFKHEAVAVDPVHRTLYLTEDEPSGRLYRFVCSASDWPQGSARPQLASGRLQVMRLKGVADNTYPDNTLDLSNPVAVEWVDAVQPRMPQKLVRASLGAKAPGTVFKGGEGMWYFNGLVYFATKGDQRIWVLDTAAQAVQVIYDFARTPAPYNVLSGVDNLTVSDWGDVIVAEDGGNMELCVVRPERGAQVLMQVTGQEGSELTGPAFSPDGRRLYVSSQRGGSAKTGITYEIML